MIVYERSEMLDFLRDLRLEARQAKVENTNEIVDLDELPVDRRIGVGRQCVC